MNSTLQKLCDVFYRVSLQHKNLASGQKSAVDLKRRIFRCRADEDYASLFHKRKERVLLCLVEAVYLVYKHYSAVSVASVFLCLLHYSAYFLYSACYGGKIYKG